MQKDMVGLQRQLKSLYASISYTSFTNSRMYEYEGYYVNVFYVYMKAIGVDIIAEDITSKGRIDITIKLSEMIYVMEFKISAVVQESPKTGINEALQQIKAKKFHEKYLSEGRNIYIVGIEFDINERNIRDVIWERVMKA